MVSLVGPSQTTVPKVNRAQLKLSGLLQLTSWLLAADFAVFRGSQFWSIRDLNQSRGLVFLQNQCIWAYLYSCQALRNLNIYRPTQTIGKSLLVTDLDQEFMKNCYSLILAPIGKCHCETYLPEHQFSVLNCSQNSLVYISGYCKLFLEAI